MDNRITDNLVDLPTVLKDRDRLEAENAELKAAIMEMSIDMHHPSMRPCGTCRKITELVGEPFGCYAWQARKGKESEGGA